MKIKHIRADIIKNSRNNPAIQVTINKKYKSSAPSGASTGSNEVPSFSNKGINFAKDFINNYQDFKMMEFEEFQDLGCLDTLIKTIGGNPIIALQFAILKAMADNNVWEFLNPKAKKLPRPVGNVIGGGAHTAQSSNDIQEFLLIPNSKSFYENAFVNNFLHKKIKSQIKASCKTDEGAWVTNLSNIEVLEFLYNYLSDKDNTLGINVDLGLDVAATSFFSRKKYLYKNFSKHVKKRNLNRLQQINFMNEIIQKYNLKYLEDPLEENDFRGFAQLNKKAWICGDDLITTNIERLKMAIKSNSVNCIIIKPNQIGSIIKTKQVVDFAHNNNIKTIISHRSGETMDATISHLAVAWKIPFLKCGISGKERQAKLNEVVKIEKQI
ncbi:MAG: enolase C-terminal domain-like protein [Nanoarchaeota archaeon]|nr:enolase C-terminal domain-like protein [Nanoarchaeota archaeon]